MFLIKVNFYGSTGEYSYRSPVKLKQDSLAVVVAPTGERKVVTVVDCIPSSLTEFNEMPFTVKPIAGIVVEFTDKQRTKKACTQDSPV